MAGALVARVAGPLAVRYPNGTPRHRLCGRLYVGAWLRFGATGFYLGARHAGVSPFEVLNGVGAGFLGAGLWTVASKRRLGRTWKRVHYRMMLTSYAFVAVATVNQVLLQLGVRPSFWVLIPLALTPFLVLPRLHRRMDRAYGFAEAETERPANTA